MALQNQQQMKFEPTWESLKQYQVPDWYQNGKFGIFGAPPQTWDNCLSWLPHTSVQNQAKKCYWFEHTNTPELARICDM